MTHSFLQKTGFKHCPKCASTHLTDRANAMVCNTCGYQLYFNCAAATSCIIRRANQILLITRKRNPGKGMLDLPGGFVDYDETLEQGMARELQEELGVTVQTLRYLTSCPNTYIYGDVQYHTLDCFFTATLAKDAMPKASDDADALEWVDMDKIELSRMAFSSTKYALKHYLNQ